MLTRTIRPLCRTLCRICLREIGRDLQGIRIGFDENYATHGIDVELADAVRAGVKTLSDQGAEIVEVELPDVDAYVSAWPTLCATEAVVAHAAYYPSATGCLRALVPRMA